jgi:hypothetical protein
MPLPVRPCESVAVIVAENVPGWVGVPTIVPLGLSIPRPGGRPVADQLYGGVPPDAWNVMELLPFDGGTYVVPRMNWKLEGLLLVMTNAANIFIDKLAKAVRLVESVTTTVNE